MSRLLSTTLIVTLSLSASGSDETDVKNFIKKYMVKSPRVKVESVDIIDKQTLDKPKGWDVYFVNIHANIEKSSTITDKVTVPETIFIKDGFSAPSLIDIKTGKDFKLELKPKLKSEIYNDKHLFAGNKDAKHKIVIFSDPQCPFCQEKVPEIYKVVKESPETFALYYYHFPLLRIHPVSDVITRVMVIEQKKGNFDKVMELYSLQIDAQEHDASKILAKINKEFKLKITEKDIDNKEIAEEIKHDKEMATKSMVAGTPTVYVDGQWDKSRNGYKKLIPSDKKK
jgi:protein-disulfide isomerase